MKRTAVTIGAILAVLLLAAGAPPPASAELVGAGLSGFQEVPVISTTGSGAFFARINAEETAMDFVLVYEDLQAEVVQAHIHIGQRGVNGGIMVHLCGSGGKSPCPASPGTVAGVLTSADVVAVAAQGIAAGELAEVIRAIRKGDAYANVHTTTFPSGEVRGQIR